MYKVRSFIIVDIQWFTNVLSYEIEKYYVSLIFVLRTKTGVLCFSGNH